MPGCAAGGRLTHRVTREVEHRYDPTWRPYSRRSSVAGRLPGRAGGCVRLGEAPVPAALAFIVALLAPDRSAGAAPTSTGSPAAGPARPTGPCAKQRYQPQRPSGTADGAGVVAAGHGYRPGSGPDRTLCPARIRARPGTPACSARSSASPQSPRAGPCNGIGSRPGGGTEASAALAAARRHLDRWALVKRGTTETRHHWNAAPLERGATGTARCCGARYAGSRPPSRPPRP